MIMRTYLMRLVGYIEKQWRQEYILAFRGTILCGTAGATKGQSG
jgi:hypothetical protein